MLIFHDSIKSSSIFKTNRPFFFLFKVARLSPIDWRHYNNSTQLGMMRSFLDNTKRFSFLPGRLLISECFKPNRAPFKQLSVFNMVDYNVA